MNLTLRRLTVTDAPAWRALRLEAFTAHPRDFRSSPGDEATVADLEALITDHHIVGLFEGETLVGAAGLIVEPRAKLAHKGTIISVYVRAAHRGQGGAERLMRALLDEARGKLEQVSLVVSDGNGPALRLYTRLGFSLMATEPRALKLPDGSYVDELTMARRFTADEAGLSRIRAQRAPLPPDYKFDRDDANSR
jgi:ribosomal protein S18 acetylase RimI-like enzyme